MQNLRLFGLAAGLAILATGCQTYKPPLDSWRSGNVQEAAKQFTAIAEKNKTTKDAVIWRLEQGAVMRTGWNGDDDCSIHLIKVADKYL